MCALDYLACLAKPLSGTVDGNDIWDPCMVWLVLMIFEILIWSSFNNDFWDPYVVRLMIMIFRITMCSGMIYI